MSDDDYKRYEWYSTLNAVAGFAGFILSGAVIICIILALAGCTTTPNKNALGTKLIARACADPEIITHTSESWSKADNDAYNTAFDRCAQLYPHSPCLKKFIRVAQYQYWAICGEMDK